MPHFANIAVSILFDGLAYAMFLFITSVGLSVTMGLMGFVNLAHGAFAMAGGYIVVSLTRSFGIGFVPSLVIASVRSAVVSVPFERCLYRRLYRSTDLEQVLLTIGLAFMAIATATYFYGPIPKSVPLPEWLQGDVNLGFRVFPSYRAFLIVLGAVLIAVLWYAFERTNIGAKIRAAVDNRRMAESVGINVDRLFTLTFAVGSGLAALGGGLAIQLFGLSPSFAVHLSRVVPDRGRGRWPRQPEGHAARGAGARHVRHRRQISARRCGRLFHLCRDRGGPPDQACGVLWPRVRPSAGHDGSRTCARARGGIFAAAAPVPPAEALPWLIAIAAFFIFPDRMTFGSQVLIMVMFALSLDLILGYAGIVTLGHAAFFGVGAYTVGLAAARFAGTNRSAGCSRPRSLPALSASSPAGSCCAIAG